MCVCLCVEMWQLVYAVAAMTYPSHASLPRYYIMCIANYHTHAHFTGTISVSPTSTESQELLLEGDQFRRLCFVDVDRYVCDVP